MIVQRFYFTFFVQNVSVFSVSEKVVLMFFLNVLLTTDKIVYRLETFTEKYGFAY